LNVKDVDINGFPEKMKSVCVQNASHLGLIRRKLIMYPSELKFLKMMEAKGFTLIYEPVRFEVGFSIMVPDFYCLEEHCFYEIIATSVDHLKIQRMFCLSVFFPGIKIKYVNPDGKPKKFKVAEKRRKVFQKHAEYLLHEYIIRQRTLSSNRSTFHKNSRRELSKITIDYLL